MAKISNNKSQANLFEVEAVAQKKQVVSNRKKGVTFEYIDVSRLGLLSCEDFGKYIREERSNKTII